jgi:hypothetical protein
MNTDLPPPPHEDNGSLLADDRVELLLRRFWIFLIAVLLARCRPDENLPEDPS